MVGISRKFLTITAGVEVTSHGRRYVVTMGFAPVFTDTYKKAD